MKILKVNNNSCSENWDKMSPNEKGKFCLNCNKKVFDFESLPDSEIIYILENKKENFCARIPLSKMNRPLLATSYISKYITLAIKIIITSSILLPGNLIAINPKENAIEHFKIVENSEITFKGKFLREEDESPIINVKIQFITLNEIFYAYTNKNGEFNLAIPTKFIGDENVFRVSYDEISYDENKTETPPRPESFSTPDFVIKRNEIENKKIITVENEIFYVGSCGMIFIGGKNGVIPLVFYKGKEISYNEYEKNKKKGLYKSDNYFGHKMAKIICVREAKNGLILLF